MRVVLRNPRREVEVAGNRRVKDILRDLDILPETVLVIRGDDLVTADQMLRDDDVIELRPVMSGGGGGQITAPGNDAVARSHERSEAVDGAVKRSHEPSEAGHPRFTPASRTPLQ